MGVVLISFLGIDVVIFCVISLVCCWKVLRWFVGVDVYLLRIIMLYISGISSVVGFDVI